MTIITTLILIHLQVCCAQYGVDPAFAYAVMRVESGTRTERIRVGRLGRSLYFGPMGIHEDFRCRWPIDDPFVNIQVGVRALQGKDKTRILKRYNKEYNAAYAKAVMSIYRQAKREELFKK